MKNNLEKLFRESLDKHEMPYDPKAWEAVEKQLPSATSPALKITLGTVAVAAIIIVSVLVFNSTPETNQTENNVVVENNETNNIVEKDVVTTNDSTTQKMEDITSNDITVEKINQENDNIVKQITPKSNHQQTVNHDQVDPITSIDNQKPPKVESSDSKWLIAAQNAFISTSSNSVCKGNTVVFILNNVPENSATEWFIGTEKVSTSKSISIEMTESGIVSARLRNLNDTKISHKLTSTFIQVTEPQNMVIEVTQDIKNTKPYFIIENKNNQINTIQWTMDYKRAQGNKMGVYLTEKGDYTYTVSARDQNGCEIEKEGVIRLGESYNLFAPTGFSPTSSDAERNAFIPKALLSRDVEFKMSIYDRSGSMIYETTDKNKPWNGSMFNGGIAAVGSYMWIVTLINEEGLPEKYKGQIVLTQ